ALPICSELDLSDQIALQDFLAAVQPDIIVNAAAYTAVDRAEEELELARIMNADMPSWLANYCAAQSKLLVHYSTDYVFDGSGQQPWPEDAPPNPLSVYGRTKLEGEQAVQKSECPFVIFRTSWVWAPSGKNFMRAVLRKATTDNHLKIVSDQIGAPTSANFLAELALYAIQQYRDGELAHGIYHAQGRGYASWHEVAQHLMQAAGFSNRVILEAILTSDWPAAAARPLNSRMNCSKLEQQFRITCPDWRQEISAHINALRA
ncbi:MAG TPA: dTDP-4-dehydrorhamnose reductase, partial [Rhodospirillaceae bacterium]|nr:dTDP-4-dehydrorhamnose reductase [Rhodospirillaceae bacterium]